MQLPTDPHLATLAEYLRYENAATSKHEYRDGRIVEMTGGSPTHSLITVNVGAELRAALRGNPCKTFDSNLRIGIPGTPLYTYPDVSVICGPLIMDPNDPSSHTATNPRLIVEVLSPTTEAYDRGKKFSRYQKLESLEEYVLISQEEPRVESFRRQADGTWILTNAVGLDARIPLASIEVVLALAEVYAGVEFPPSEE